MNNILFFLTPKAMCAFLYDDFTLRQALEKMETAGFAALPILNKRGEYRGVEEPLLHGHTAGGGPSDHGGIQTKG